MSDEGLPPPGSGTPPPPPPPVPPAGDDRPPDEPIDPEEGPATPTEEAPTEGAPDEDAPSGAGDVEDAEMAGEPADDAGAVGEAEGAGVAGEVTDATPEAGTEVLWGAEDDSVVEDPLPTTEMATAVMAGGPATGMLGPEEVPGSYPLGGDFTDEEPLPWYKQRGPLIAAILGGVVAIFLAVALGIWLFGGGDDDPDIANRVVIDLVDETGEKVKRELTGKVVGPDEFPKSFEWLRPTDADAPKPAVVAPTNENVEFVWAATEEVGDQALWLSTFTLTERLPKGWRAPRDPVQCIREREDGAKSNLEMSVKVEPKNIDKRRTVTYRFADHLFRPGDTVSCRLVSQRPAPTPSTTTTTSSTTTSSTTTTTTSTTTTTTTVPETTTTTSTTTTTVPETTTTTSTTTTTVPETTTTTTVPEEGTAWEAIQQIPEVSDFVTLATDCGWDAGLNDPSITFTLFVPDNDALNVPGGGCPGGAEAIFLTHVHDNAALTEGDLDGLVGQKLEMRSGTFADVTAGPQIGGAAIATPDVQGSNGITHVVDKVIQTSP